MNYLQRRYNQVCIIVNYMIKLRCSVTGESRVTGICKCAPFVACETH